MTNDYCVGVDVGMMMTLMFLCVKGLPRRPPNYEHDSMPDTTFTCKDKVVGGYYADPDADCQMFHICVQVDEHDVSSTPSTHSFLSLTRSFVLIVILRYSFCYWVITNFISHIIVSLYILPFNKRCMQATTHNLLNYKYQHTNKYSK